jgi:hypothetical protein
MMRSLYLAILGAAVLSAAEDPKAIVKRALDADLAAQDAARHYTFLQRDDVRMLDGSGGSKSHSVKTWDVTLLEGSPFKRLVARDDKPLSPAEQKSEQDRLQFGLEQRRKESPAQRQQRIAEWDRKRREQTEHLREIPDAFDFTLAGEGQLDGHPVWIIDGSPHKGYKPKSSFAAYFTRIKGRCWIAKDSPHFVKLEFDTLDTISVGGFVLRLKKGSHIAVEQAHVNDEIWLPSHVVVKASARILLVKGFNLDADYRFTDYKKFQAESRIVSSQPK